MLVSNKSCTFANVFSLLNTKRNYMGSFVCGGTMYVVRHIYIYPMGKEMDEAE